MSRDPGEARPRLDSHLVEAGLASTRARAQSLILQGKVRVEGRTVSKPGTRLKPGARVEVTGVEEQPVGRGYRKLEEGIRRLGLDVQGAVCLDAGASTGGFTEHLLERGAGKVYAVDVGYGQLAWKLRQDPRVEVMERTNVRFVEPSNFDPRPGILVADLSFISLTKVLPNLGQVLLPGAPGVVLVKPQFEAGRARVEKGGLVRRPEVHRAVLEEVLTAVQRLGWRPLGLCPSPIQGAKGNREFLLKLRAPGDASEEEPLGAGAVQQAVEEAHN